MRAFGSVLAAAAIALTACAPAETSEPTTSTSVSSEQSPETTQPLVAGCPEEGTFVEDGDISIDNYPGPTSTGSDSTTIGRISWSGTDACETFAFSFVTSEGAPATTPPAMRARYLEGLPVIRLSFDVDRTVVTDQLVETQLVDRLYVVRGLDGSIFVDLYLAAPAQARLSVARSPSGATLALQPGIVEHTARPATSALVVLVNPASASDTGSPLRLTGYARTFESNVLMIATSGDEVVGEASTTAADSIHTWGEFAATLELDPGDVTLFVGEESPLDGSLDGVTVGLTVR